MSEPIKDVHTEHCCILHGCKYADVFCTVTTRKAEQSFICEGCDMQGIKNLKMLQAVMEGRQKRCKHCGHIV